MLLPLHRDSIMLWEFPSEKMKSEICDAYFTSGVKSFSLELCSL